MSHLENVLKMLFKLKKGIIIKRNDLARELCVSEKQITRYKRDLESLFTIESILGPNGGYRLLDSYFPFKELLTKDEIMLLQYYGKEIQYIDNEVLSIALNKINYSILKDNSSECTEIIPYSRINNDGADIKDIQNKLYEAILNKNVVLITYGSNEGKQTKRRIQPYKIFIYKGQSYVIAKCLLKNEVRIFKLVRIAECIVTSKQFEREFDVEAYINELRNNSIGIFGGKEYKLKLEICPPMSNTIKERIWIDNQIITNLKNGNILFEAKMRGGPEIISWILSMRSCVKVIEPQILKDEIEKELEKMMKKLK
ncbi:UNVERIFIED_ORG: transcriptional regulator [Clostridium botulinum]|nr:WYL domain-containing protein [Clostridium botulinum]